MGLDEESEAALAACGSVDAFERAAAERGVALTVEQRAHAAQPDPLGLAFLLPVAPDTEHWPSPAWLPVNLALLPEPVIDWVRFDEPPALLDRAALRRAAQRPFNGAFRKRMRLGDFMARAEAGPAPAGFLFHMSRCGSTLAARMFASVPGISTLSELPTISEAVALAHRLPQPQSIALLHAIFAAYGRGSGKLLVRLEAPSTLAIASIVRAFPQTPIAFLYRDPVEVLVSYARDSGIEPAFAGNLASLWSGGDLSGLGKDDLTARGLAKICKSAAAHIAAHGGLAVNYRDLPGAVTQKILAHFGIAVDAQAREAMQHIARRNAKIGTLAFTSDSADKQRAADDALRARAERELGAVYRALEALGAGAFCDAIS